jgi:hypothetical protein
MNFGIPGALTLLVIALVLVLPMWRILEKAGFPPALSLISIIPIGILVPLFVLAFAEWPVQKAKD